MGKIIKPLSQYEISKKKKKKKEKLYKIKG